MPKILLVEDDKNTASFIVKGLKQEGFTVDHCPDGAQGLDFALNSFYDAMILDIMLPKLDGLCLLTRLREQNITTPAIFLSAKSSVDDRINGFKMGGDDYIVKPFSFSELIVRIKAILRRSVHTINPTIIKVGDLVMDTEKRIVKRANQEILLQPKEFMLLEYLLKNSGQIISKTMIMERVWDYNFDPQTNVVEARICQLRNKIDKPFTHSLIHTIRGVGYVIKENK